MQQKINSYTGCLLGMAVGDALGCAVDALTLEQILADYGPNGLMGYDPRTDLAEISAYTQLAVVTGNALLVAMSRGRTDTPCRYVAHGLREWIHCRQGRMPERQLCWCSQIPQLRRRNCTDNRLVDALSREPMGTQEAPVNRTDSPAAMMSAVGVGMFYDEKRISAGDVGDLALNTAVLTNGAPEAMLCASAVAFAVAGVLQEPQRALQEQFLQAATAVRSLYGRQYPQAAEVAAGITSAVRLAADPTTEPLQILEGLDCTDSISCLCGAVYTCLVHPGNFDEAMVTAVNHSGRSAAVAAVTGAILGAKLGEEGIPEFYLHTLESASYLRCLAEDLAVGNPAIGLFDDDWDQKYTYGTPV